MLNICTNCHQKSNSFAILCTKPIVCICDSCLNTCPCGLKGTWLGGKITCPHGTIYSIGYETQINTYRQPLNTVKLLFILVSNDTH